MNSELGTHFLLPMFLTLSQVSGWPILEWWGQERV